MFLERTILYQACISLGKLLPVVTLNLIEVMGFVLASILNFFLFLGGFYFNDVNGTSYGRACLLCFVSTITAALLILIFVGFFGSFRPILRSLGFPRSGFSFLGPGILYWRVLDMRFSSYEAITLGRVLIGFTDIRSRLESGLCLNVNRFFNYFTKAIKVLATFFHFYSHQELQFCWKVPNHFVFLWRSVWVRFD